MKKSFLALGLLSIILLAGCSQPTVTNYSDLPETTIDPNVTWDGALDGYGISAIIDGNIADLPQHNWPNVNTSNTYFSGYEETWAQAFIEGDSRWEIRVHDTKLEDQAFPFTPTSENQFSIQYSPNKIDNENCGGVDNGCAFFMTSERGALTITSFKNDTIEGTFSGTMHLQSTGFSRFQDKDTTLNVENGVFRIKLRRDDSPAV